MRLRFRTSKLGERGVRYSYYERWISHRVETSKMSSDYYGMLLRVRIIAQWKHQGITSKIQGAHIQDNMADSPDDAVTNHEHVESLTDVGHLWNVVVRLHKLKY